MTVFSDAIAALASSTAAVHGVSVTYVRGVHEVTLTAVPGQTLFESQTDDGLVTQFTSRDYLITAAELILDSEQVEPEVGDTIVEEIGGIARTHRVLAPGSGEQPFRFCDTQRTRVRVHTKEISAA